MKYFLDCEFIEDGQTIELISIGLVAEDGREYYAVNSQCDLSKASEWVELNVLRPIGLAGCKSIQAINPTDPCVSPNTKNSLIYSKPKHAIADEIYQFVAEDLAFSGNPDNDMGSVVFWGEWPSYDWVVLCQLFGTMMELPDGFPMRCNDIIQEAERRGLTSDDLPPSLETDGNHNALLGAKTVKMRYEWLMECPSTK